MRIEEEIYNIYPRKIKKYKAFKAIRDALNRLPLELKSEGKVVPNFEKWLKEKTAQFANSPAGQRGHYTPHPATWFNSAGYLDDEAEWQLMSDKEEENIRKYREANVGVWRPE